MTGCTQPTRNASVAKRVWRYMKTTLENVSGMPSAQMVRLQLEKL